MSPKDLPEDPELLKTMLIDLMGEVERLNHQLAQLRRHVFGRRSEGLSQDQLLLGLAGVALPQAPTPEPVAPISKPRTNGTGHGRKPFPAHLPRQRIEYPLPESERTCKSCQSPMAKIGEEVSSQLEYVPSSFFIKEHVRFKYACKGCEDAVVISQAPAQPIEKGSPGPGLLAHVLTSKFADHLPLHRQSRIFERSEIDLSRSTLCDWVAKSAALLEPLVQEMHREILKSKRIHTDDTPVPVLDPPQNKTRESRLWVYIGDEDHPFTVFDYTPTRCREGPEDFLRDFEGFLQADAYKGYDDLYRDGTIVEVGCWAHARRRFFDAQTSDRARALTAIASIKLVYKVEREAKGLEAAVRRGLRQTNAKPLLDAFKTWLDEQTLAVLPKSPMGEAIGYTLRQWGALTRYLDDGDLEIDNNRAERSLRAIVVGRNNWTFAGSDAGGRRAATIYSLVASCQQHGVDPFAYLRDVLDRVSTHPAREIAALLPPAWKAAQPPLSSSV